MKAGYDMRLEIVGAVLELGVLLLRKNAGYGNSAADPLAVFSKLGAVERLGVRMDDKLSRIARGREDGQEDTRGDLAGYLVLDGIVRGMRDGAEPVVWGDVEGLWGEVMEELEDSRRGAEAQREEGKGEEDSRRGAEPQRGAGEERGERRGGLEVVMGDGELCVRVPVGLWERTLEEAEESRRAAEAQREQALVPGERRVEELVAERAELVAALETEREHAGILGAQLEEAVAHGARLQEELNALVRAHEEGEEDSRRGAEPQREEGKGEEELEGVAGGAGLITDH